MLATWQLLELNQISNQIRAARAPHGQFHRSEIVTSTPQIQGIANPVLAMAAISPKSST